MPFLYLSHGILGLLCLMGASLEEGRSRLVGIAGSAGVVLGVALFFARHAEAQWRTTTVTPGPVAAAGLAVACAWLLLLVLDRARGDWQTAALTGVAACGLILFAANRWVVPALLFWVASSIALATTAREATGRVQLWLQLAIGDALLIGALVSNAVIDETWSLPSSTRSTTFWLVAAAAILRAGIVPRIGAWAVADRVPHVLPLLGGGSFVLLTGVADNEEPWLALALILGALAIALRSLVVARTELAFLGAWPVALMLATLLVVPGAPWQAGAAGLLGLTVVLLWPHALGRAQVERGLMVAFLPPTAGFSAVVAAAVATFDRATATSSIIRSAPWTGVTALLPAALAAGLLLGVRVSRRIEAERYEPAAVIATWLVLLAAVVAGLWPRFALEGSAIRVFTLHIVALSVGVLAARSVRASATAAAPIGHTSDFAPHALELPSSASRTAMWAAAALGAAASAGVAWLTVRGLQVGFL